MQNDTSSTACAIAVNRGKAGGNKQPVTSRFRYKCYNCGLVGHMRKDCKREPKENKTSEDANVTAEADIKSETGYTFCVGEDFDEKSDWCLDSGATKHMANETVSLINVKSLPKPIKIKVTKFGQTLTAKESRER